MLNKENYIKYLQERKDFIRDMRKHSELMGVISYFNSGRDHGAIEIINHMLSVIEVGAFDLKPEAKEACRWENIDIQMQSSGIYDPQINSFKVLCENNVFAAEKDFVKNKIYKFCPYCSKPIQVVEDE